jgi:hypothetical protein
MTSPLDKSLLNSPSGEESDLLKCNDGGEGELELGSPVMELDRLPPQALNHLEEWTNETQASCSYKGAQSSFSPEWSPGEEEEEELDEGRTELEQEVDSDLDTAASRSDEEEEEFTDYENQGIVDYQARVEQVKLRAFH